MKMLFFNILIFVSVILESRAQTCDQIDQCSCQMSDTGKVISLWRIDDKSPPRFSDVKQMYKPPYTIDYNPCTPFSKGSGNYQCHDDLVCQNSGDGNFYSLGMANNFVTSIGPDSVVFQYKGGTQESVSRQAQITLICDPKATKPTMSRPQEVEQGIYTFVLTTECACPGTCKVDEKSNGTDGLSIGSILLILLLVFVLVYVIGGFLLLKFVSKKEGTEVIPHYEFWKDFPAKVKEGVLFTKSKLKRKNAEYQEI